MILQRIFGPRTIILTLAVATLATGQGPSIWPASEFEKRMAPKPKPPHIEIDDQLTTRKRKPRKARQLLNDEQLRDLCSTVATIRRSNSLTAIRDLDRAIAKSPTDVGGTLKRFKQMDDDARRAYCTDDVYSKQWKPPKFDKNDPSYGRPKEGSLTEQRGIAAGHHVCKEIIQLCEIIDENGARQTDGTVVISFGELFKTYQWISDKVVGMLLRARKHKLVDFEGEMLYQRRDEQVPVTLIRTMGEVRQMYSQTDDPKSVLKNIW